MSLPRNTKQDVKVDIKEGDTIWDLSQKLGVDVGAASGYKSGDPNLIYPGEQLTFKGVSLDKYAQFAEDRLKSTGMNNPEHSVPDMLKENADAAKKNMEDKVQQSQQQQSQAQSNGKQVPKGMFADPERSDKDAQRKKALKDAHAVITPNADDFGEAQHKYPSRGMPGSHGAVDMNAAKKAMSDAAKDAQDKKVVKEQSQHKDNKTKSTQEKAAKENLDAYNKAMHEQSDDLKAWFNSLPKDIGTRRSMPSESMYAFPGSDSFRQRDANNFHNFIEARKEDARRDAASKVNAEKSAKDDKTKSTQEKAPQTNADKFKSALSADNDEYRSWAQSRELDPRMFKYRYESDPQGVTKQYADDFGNYSKQYQQEHAKSVDKRDARNRAASFTPPAADHADTKAMAAVAGMSSASKGISQSNHQAKETAEQNLKKPIQDAADKAIHKMNEKIAKKNVFQMSADMNRGNNALSREHEGSAERSRSQHLQDAMQHMMNGMALGNDSREMSA